jgi:hypothetical protein
MVEANVITTWSFDEHNTISKMVVGMKKHMLITLHAWRGWGQSAIYLCIMSKEH